MTQEQARRKVDALGRMTVARGCTEGEARSAARLAQVLAARYGLTPPRGEAHYRPDFDQRFRKAEARTAVRFRWEYRSCGKPRCRCAAPGAPRHGPYRYGKRRQGRKVSSIYIGR